MNLETFDENAATIELSPRSLETCKLHDINPTDLLYRSQDSFAHSRLTNSQVESLFKLFESRRQLTLQNLRTFRQFLINDQLNSQSIEPTLTSFSMNPTPRSRLELSPSESDDDSSEEPTARDGSQLFLDQSRPIEQTTIGSLSARRSSATSPMSRTKDGLTESRPFHPQLSIRSLQMSDDGGILRRSQRLESQRKAKVEQLRAAMEKKELSENRPPTLNQRSLQLMSGKESVTERNDRFLSDKQEKLDEMRQDELERTLQTIQPPKINRKSKVLDRSVNDLFEWEDERQKRLEDEENRILLEERQNATFSPHLSQRSRALAKDRHTDVAAQIHKEQLYNKLIFSQRFENEKRQQQEALEAEKRKRRERAEKILQERRYRPAREPQPAPKEEVRWSRKKMNKTEELLMIARLGKTSRSETEEGETKAPARSQSARNRNPTQVKPVAGTEHFLQQTRASSAQRKQPLKHLTSSPETTQKVPPPKRSESAKKRQSDEFYRRSIELEQKRVERLKLEKEALHQKARAKEKEMLPPTPKRVATAQPAEVKAVHNMRVRGALMRQEKGTVRQSLNISTDVKSWLEKEGEVG
ncbi:hypothetical protein BLNAU_2584 [Blattamonas nauphoetae]|uniref:Uncharacterized protein n=1 Tax=Blattamonas nauphoetae TaxID=2049346 RepID=A0ABQ9YEZ1_9EUKA|nr:hypothetical protein BLNAU_2584 [Blattamonas nauphoetae]